jgi:hypothetical protein
VHPPTRREQLGSARRPGKARCSPGRRRALRAPLREGAPVRCPAQRLVGHVSKIGQTRRAPPSRSLTSLRSTGGMSTPRFLPHAIIAGCSGRYDPGGRSRNHGHEGRAKRDPLGQGYGRCPKRLTTHPPTPAGSLQIYGGNSPSARRSAIREGRTRCGRGAIDRDRRRIAGHQLFAREPRAGVRRDAGKGDAALRSRVWRAAHLRWWVLRPSRLRGPCRRLFAAGGAEKRADSSLAVPAPGTPGKGLTL